jgi:hypothetical protein
MASFKTGAETMLRKLLVLTFISFAGWSQPAQPQAQAPIVVKVEMPPTPHGDFLGYLQALGPLIAACVAVGVALTQRHLQKQQLKQNLFEKRFAVYEAIKRHLVESMSGYPTWVWHLLNFPMKGQAIFLFGADMVGFCAELDAMIMRWDWAFSQCCEIGPESGEKKLKERTSETEGLFREMRHAREPIGMPMIDKLEQLLYVAHTFNFRTIKAGWHGSSLVFSGGWTRTNPLRWHPDTILRRTTQQSPPSRILPGSPVWKIAPGVSGRSPIAEFPGA